MFSLTTLTLLTFLNRVRKSDRSYRYRTRTHCIVNNTVFARTSGTQLEVPATVHAIQLDIYNYTLTI